MNKIISFFMRIIKMVCSQLPLFVMLIAYTTIPTFFDGWYSIRNYFSVTLGQVLLPIILLCCLGSLKRWLWWCVFVVANLMFLVELGCYFCQHTRFGSIVALLFMQTNFAESREFLSTALIPVLKAGAISVLTMMFFLSFDFLWRKYLAAKIDSKLKVKNRFIGIVVSILIVLICTRSLFLLYSIWNGYSVYWMRINGIKEDASTFITYYYAFADSFFNPEVQDLAILNESISQATVDVDNTAQEMIVVYVLGESFSRVRSSLFGYPMKVNPALEQEYNNGRLFKFDNVVSHSQFTMDVYKTLLSTNDITGPKHFADFPLLPALLKKAGYYVEYYDNQTVITADKGFDFGCTYFLIDHAVRDQSIDEYNEDKCTFDGDFVDKYPPLIKSNKSFIIYHLMGQHDTFDKRYPQNFSFFSAGDYPDGYYTSTQAVDVAHYDNATLYNDYVLSKIIDQIRDKVSILIYVPDHGEEVYDFRDHMGRELNVTKETIRVYLEVPVFIWVSEKYEELFPQKVDMLRGNFHKAIYNSDLPHTVLDAAGVMTETFVPEFSLFRIGAGRTNRIIKGIDYDANREIIDSNRMRYEQ